MPLQWGRASCAARMRLIDNDMAAFDRIATWRDPTLGRIISNYGNSPVLSGGCEVKGQAARLLYQRTVVVLGWTAPPGSGPGMESGSRIRIVVSSYGDSSQAIRLAPNTWNTASLWKAFMFPAGL